MRGAQKAHVRIIGPAPAWEEYARQKAFREARRDVDQQPGDLPGKYGFEVGADGLHVPAPDKRVAGLHHMPSLMDEVG